MLDNSWATIARCSALSPDGTFKACRSVSDIGNTHAAFRPENSPLKSIAAEMSLAVHSKPGGVIVVFSIRNHRSAA